MKIFLFFLCAITLLTSCTKNSSTSQIPPEQSLPTQATISSPWSNTWITRDSSTFNWDTLVVPQNTPESLSGSTTSNLIPSATGASDRLSEKTSTGSLTESEKTPWKETVKEVMQETVKKEEKKILKTPEQIKVEWKKKTGLELTPEQIRDIQQNPWYIPAGKLVTN
jgi:hypothetical protein